MMPTFEENAFLVRVVIQKYPFYAHPMLDWDDLIQQGTLGLLRALNDYKEEKGGNFRCFAMHCIRNALRSQSDAMHWVPRTERQKRDTTFLRLVPLESAWEIAAENDPFPRQHIPLEILTEEERRVIVGLYYHQKTYNCLTAEMGFRTQININRLRSKALQKLRKALCSDYSYPD